MADSVVISSYARTPIGGLQGALSTLTSVELGAVAARAVVSRATLPHGAVDQIIMGCVLSAGLGQAPARQVAIGAGLPNSVGATTVNKMCGSGMQSVILAHDAISAGAADIIVAGGMESMTNAPYLLKKHRSGSRIGHDTSHDSMYLDGLEDAYEPGRLMGSFAEQTAADYQITREAMDEYAISSLANAKAAAASGAFRREIVPVSVVTSRRSTVVESDEQPDKADVLKIPTLRPAFSKDGAITAANASSISDGAAALVLARESVARDLGALPVARVVGHSFHAHEPSQFATAPVPAINKLLARIGWRVEDVDLFEVNEAFAVVAMVAEKELGIERAKLNVNGGACALGHPIGASGSRILTTLLAALQERGGRRGVASLCIGGGEATAIAIELI